MSSSRMRAFAAASSSSAGPEKYQKCQREYFLLKWRLNKQVIAYFHTSPCPSRQVLQKKTRTSRQWAKWINMNPLVIITLTDYGRSDFARRRNRGRRSVQRGRRLVVSRCCKHKWNTCMLNISSYWANTVNFNHSLDHCCRSTFSSGAENSNI